MAEYYTQFCEDLPMQTEEEEKWLQHQLELVPFPVPEPGPGDESSITCCRFLAEAAENKADWIDPDDCGELDSPGFDYYFTKAAGGDYTKMPHSLCIFECSEGSGRIDYLGNLVQMYLQKFHSASHNLWTLQWAEVSIPAKLDAFGGGLMIVSPELLDICGTDGFDRQFRRFFAKPPGAAGPDVSVAECREQIETAGPTIVEIGEKLTDFQELWRTAVRLEYTCLGFVDWMQSQARLFLSAFLAASEEEAPEND